MTLDQHHLISRPARVEGPHLRDHDVPDWDDEDDGDIPSPQEHARPAYRGDFFGVEYWINYRERRWAEHLDAVTAHPGVHDPATCPWCDEHRHGLARLREIQAEHDRGVA